MRQCNGCLAIDCFLQLQVAPVNTVKDGMAGFCTFGSYGLPELAKNKLRNYYYPYEQCIMRGLTVSGKSGLTCA